MNFEISSQSQRILETAVNSGHFKDKEEALAEAIRLLSEKTEELNGTTLSADAWCERFQQHFIDTPATTATFVDVSRETIYEGRGE